MKKFLTLLVALTAIGTEIDGSAYASTLFLGMTQEQMGKLTEGISWHNQVKSPIFDAIEKGDMNHLQIAITMFKDNPAVPSADGKFALDFAIQKNQREMAKFIYKQIDPSVSDDDIDKKIQELAENPQDNAVKQDDNAVEQDEGTTWHNNVQFPIFDAIENGNMAHLQIAIEKFNDDPKATNADGKSALSFAIEKNQINMAKYLCKQIYSYDKRIAGDIHSLSRHLKELLSNDNSKLQSVYGAQAPSPQAIEIAKFMINQSYTKDEFDNDKIVHALIIGKLDYTFEQGDNPDEVSKLMETYAITPDFGVQNDQWSPVHYAAYYGCINTLKLQLDKCNPGTKFTNVDLAHPITESARKGHLDAVKIIYSNANIEKTDEDLERAIRDAADAGQINVLEFLENETGKKADLDRALRESIYRGLDAVKKLYAYATDGTGPARISNEAIAKTIEGACYRGCVDILEYLDNLSGNQVDLKPAITDATRSGNMEKIRKLYNYITQKNRMSAEDFAVTVFDGVTNYRWISKEEKLEVLKFLCEETPALLEMVRNGTTDKLYSKLGEQDGELKKYLDDQSYKTYTDNSKTTRSLTYDN